MPGPRRHVWLRGGNDGGAGVWGGGGAVHCGRGRGGRQYAFNFWNGKGSITKHTKIVEVRQVDLLFVKAIEAWQMFAGRTRVKRLKGGGV